MTKRENANYGPKKKKKMPIAVNITSGMFLQILTFYLLNTTLFIQVASPACVSCTRFQNPKQGRPSIQIKRNLSIMSLCHSYLSLQHTVIQTH